MRGFQPEEPVPLRRAARVADYLSQRGKRSSRHAFLTVKAPTRPIRRPPVGDVVQRDRLHAGTSSRSPGAS